MSESSVASRGGASAAATTAGPAHVDDRERERFVERGVGVGDPNDSPAIPEGLVERAPEQDRDVFGGVVRVDLEVALRLHHDVK
jgi:hypothetical protein